MLTTRVAIRQEPCQWRCRRCGHVLGVHDRETVTIVHRRRRITAHLPCSVVCDHCGALNTKEREAR